MVLLKMKYLYFSYLLTFVIFGFTNPLTVTRQAKDSFPKEGSSCSDPHSSGGLGSSTCTCNPDHATIMSPMGQKKPALCINQYSFKCYHSLHSTDNTYLVTKTHLNEKINPPVPDNFNASIIQIYLWNTESYNRGIWLDITDIGPKFFRMNIKSPQEMSLEIANLDLKFWQGHLIMVRFGKKIYQPCLTLKMSGNLTYPFGFEVFKAHFEPPTTTKRTTTTTAITAETPTKPTTKITTKTRKRTTITEIPTKPATIKKEITTKAATTIKTVTVTTTPTTTTTSTEPQTTTSTLSTAKTTQKVLTSQPQKTITPIITKPKTQKVSSTKRAKTSTSTVSTRTFHSSTTEMIKSTLVTKTFNTTQSSHVLTSSPIKSSHTVYYAVFCPFFGLLIIALLVLLIRTKFLKKPIRKSLTNMKKLGNTVQPAKDIVDMNTPM